MSESKDAEFLLAEAEYTNRFLLTCSFMEAEHSYRQALGDLNAKIPDRLHKKVIDLRRKMLDVLEPEILQARRKEYKELKLLEAHLHRLTLSGDIAETGIPDELKMDNLRGIDADDLTSIINGYKKLQEMRREILSS